MEFCIFKRMDDLGRIVIPKEYRKYFNINQGETLRLVCVKEGILIKVKKEESSTRT